MGENRLFQKNDPDLRLLPSVPIKIQRKKKVTTEELKQVIRMLLRKSQIECFGSTYQALVAGKPMAASD